MCYQTGEYVVYGGSEICRIDEIVQKCFDGVGEMNYYKLIPCDSANASYYVPCAHMEERVRPLLTKDEVFRIIDEMPRVKEQWISDKNERRAAFGRTLHSSNYHHILSMMKGIYSEKQKRSRGGKQLILSDEKAFSAAQRMIRREFSFVLGIREEDIDGFIEKRIGAADERIGYTDTETTGADIVGA